MVGVAVSDMEVGQSAELNSDSSLLIGCAAVYRLDHKVIFFSNQWGDTKLISE